jgi:hypothetical protein
VANPKHVEILKKGVADWNAWWSSLETTTGPDFNQADLSDIEYLDWVTTRHPDLSDADLSHTELSSAYLNWVNLNDSDLRGVNLSRASLCHAGLSAANLIDADLTNANLRGADLSGADLSNSNLFGANLSNSELGGADKPSPNDPKVWFPSVETLAQVLSTRNQLLLEIIQRSRPASLQELAKLSGRQPGNLTRTLKTMERYRIVRLEKVGKTVVPVAPWD